MMIFMQIVMCCGSLIEHVFNPKSVLDVYLAGQRNSISPICLYLLLKLHWQDVWITGKVKLFEQWHSWV